MLDLTIGKEEADTFSVRTHFLRTYDICFNVMLFLFLIVFTLTLRKLIEAKVFPRSDIPFTFANIRKYLRLRISNTDLPERQQA
jgi:hypothetical protein